MRRISFILRAMYAQLAGGAGGEPSGLIYCFEVIKALAEMENLRKMRRCIREFGCDARVSARRGLGRDGRERGGKTAIER
jgi:hypothetical protein